MWGTAPGKFTNKKHFMFNRLDIPSTTYSILGEECDALHNPSILNFSVSLALALGIIVSYLPQHIRIIRRRTSEGISQWFLLLGVSSGVSAMCNIFLFSSKIFSCCTIIVSGIRDEVSCT
jgi:uncharacterized protein with PQ loop repeat